MKTLLTLLLLQIPFPGPGRAPWSGGGGSPTATFKGESHTNADPSSTTIATPGTLNVATGDFIVVTVGVNSNPTVTLACGVDSLTEVKSWFGSDGYTVKTFIKQNATANAAATCTATFSFAQTFRSIGAANFSGVATSGGALQTSCNDASCNTLASTSTTRTAQNVTTTTANTLLLCTGINWNGGITFSGSNGFSTGITGVTPFMSYKSINATGSHPAGACGTVNSTDQYASHFVVVGLL